MSGFHFAPPVRQNTPLIIGIAGPTKSGKTYSAHRVARGLAGPDGVVAMVNSEGPKGHLYQDRFNYVATEMAPPYRPERYLEALEAAFSINPAVAILDSMSHMHDGQGGMLEYHEDEIDRILGSNKNDYKARQRNTFNGWVKPTAAERKFLNALTNAPCHVILCFRAKEKLKIVTGQEPVNMGWRPITRDSISFETLVTMILPPHSDGVPDMQLSEMRETFLPFIPAGEQLSEETGARLAAWAAGAKPGPADVTASSTDRGAQQANAAGDGASILADRLIELGTELGAGDATREAVEANRTEHTLEPAKHVAWLKRQIKTAEANVKQKVAA